MKKMVNNREENIIKETDNKEAINREADNKEAATQEDFSLYTERIVVNPFVKYKKFFALLKLIAAAVIFGIVASFVMSWVYPAIESRNQEEESKAPLIVLDKDIYPVESLEGSEAASENTTEMTGSGKHELTMTEIIDKVKKSVIGVDKDYTSADKALSSEVSSTQTVGLLIGETSDKYIAITNYDVVSEINECIVKFNESTECNAKVIGKHKELELAVLSIMKKNVPDTTKNQIAIAVLDNSYILKQGDSVVAYGKLNGKNEVSSHSYITGISSKSITDGVYDVIETAVPAMVGDYCFIFNTSGNVVGISRDLEKNDNLMVAGISDMKTMIEILTAGNEIVYLGIKGTTINNAIALKYGFPQGVYISDVVMDSPAYNAGLQSGDIVTAFNGNSVLTIRSFSEKLYKCASGQVVSIDVKRYGNEEYRNLNYSVTLSNK